MDVVACHGTHSLPEVLQAIMCMSFKGLPLGHILMDHNRAKVMDHISAKAMDHISAKVMDHNRAKVMDHNRAKAMDHINAKVGSATWCMVTHHDSISRC